MLNFPMSKKDKRRLIAGVACGARKGEQVALSDMRAANKFMQMAEIGAYGCSRTKGLPVHKDVKFDCTELMKFVNEKGLL